MKKLLLLSLSIIISSCASGLQLVDKAPYVIGYSSKDKIETLKTFFTEARAYLQEKNHAENKSRPKVQTLSFLQAERNDLRIFPRANE